MMTNKLEGEKYSIEYDPQTFTVNFEGSLRRMGMAEYEPIEQFLESVTQEESSTIILNLKELKLLNSAGIRMLSKFMINMRKKQNIQVTIKGSKEITWQESSLPNLHRLMPLSVLIWE